MTLSLVPSVVASTAEQQRRISGRTWASMYLAILFVSAVLGVLTIHSSPAPFAVPLTMLLMALALVLVKPVAGIYLVAFFMLFTDASISPWFPFAKNLSSRESMLFVADAVILSPLELILLLTLCSWLLRVLLEPADRGFVRGGLLRPMLVFSAFLWIGFILGEATGGNRYVAIWEFRPFLYLPVLYLLLTNLFTTRRQYFRLAGVMLAALVVHGLLALQVLARMEAAERETLETLVDHASAIQMSVVLIVAIAAWLLPGTPGVLRLVLPVAAIPVGWAWLVSQRRAAVIGVAVTFVLLGIMLAKLNPSRLRRLGPLFGVVMVVYVSAFWRSESLLGFPAQALKTVIAPSETSEEDQGSSIYRVMENADISATIRAKPITGLGFGHKFLRPVPLPNISSFVFHEYVPHNSVLWIWIKAGVGGFIAMIFLLGSAVRMGVRGMMRVRPGREVLLVFAGTSYVVMYLVFAYVDIAWDARSMVALAVAMAVCSEFARLPADSEDAGPSTNAAAPPAAFSS